MKGASGALLSYTAAASRPRSAASTPRSVDLSYTPRLQTPLRVSRGMISRRSEPPSTWQARLVPQLADVDWNDRDVARAEHYSLAAGRREWRVAPLSGVFWLVFADFWETGETVGVVVMVWHPAILLLAADYKFVISCLPKSDRTSQRPHGLFHSRDQLLRHPRCDPALAGSGSDGNDATIGDFR